MFTSVSSLASASSMMGRRMQVQHMIRCMWPADHDLAQVRQRTEHRRDHPMVVPPVLDMQLSERRGDGVNVEEGLEAWERVRVATEVDETK
jgi:hypothetical protein